MDSRDKTQQIAKRQAENKDLNTSTHSCLFTAAFQDLLNFKNWLAGGGGVTRMLGTWDCWPIVVVRGISYP